jgi:hypothetical protein
MTATSGPGVSLMLEAIGLAVMTETPLVLVNIMRGGPSTGQPTKGQQGDVMQPKHQLQSKRCSTRQYKLSTSLRNTELLCLSSLMKL